MVSGSVKAASVDFSHLTTLPILPLRTRFAGFVPEQISCAEAMLPPTEAGLTVINLKPEDIIAHVPFWTTALNLVLSERFPEV